MHPVVRRYTMLGTGFEPELNGAAEEVRQLRGLIPRVFDDMFTRLAQMGEQTEVRDVGYDSRRRFHACKAHPHPLAKCLIKSGARVCISELDHHYCYRNG
jgi:hypothetical protein